MWEEPGPSGESISSSLSEFCILVAGQYRTRQVKAGYVRPGQPWFSDSDVRYGEVRSNVSVVAAGREEEVGDGGGGDGRGAGHLTQL